MQTKNNIDKRLEAKSDLTAAAKLADLEKQSFDLEQSIIEQIKTFIVVTVPNSNVIPCSDKNAK